MITILNLTNKLMCPKCVENVVEGFHIKMTLILSWQKENSILDVNIIS